MDNIVNIDNKVDSYRLDIDLGSNVESKFIEIKKDRNESNDNDDWWHNFKSAVENPEVSIYEYIKNSTLTSLEIESENAEFRHYMAGARRKAFNEVLNLKDPKELKDKLKSLESNKFLFPLKVRAGLKLSRVIVETYFLNKSEKGKNKESEVLERAIRDNDINETVKEISKSLSNESEKEIKKTINSAVDQLVDDNNMGKMTRDVMRMAKKYLNLDNAAMVAITALPLVTWKYRWALAISLGTYSARMSVVHTAKSAYFRLKGDKYKAKQESQKIMKSLKSAGGNVLLIALSPKLVKVPKMLLTGVNFLIRVSYDAVLDTVHDMLEQEEKNPNTTPLSKKIKQKVRKFFGKHKDPLATITVHVAKEMSKKDVGDKMVKVSNRVSFSSIYKIARGSYDLGKSIKKRFNNMAKNKIEKIETIFTKKPRENKQKIDYIIGSSLRDVRHINSMNFDVEKVKLIASKNKKIDIEL